ncbi:MAG TPA: hypothetical protein VIV60_11085, partial [Polyangiaceae bacterium]
TSAKGGSSPSGGSSSSTAGGTSAKGGTSSSNGSSVGGTTAAGGTSSSSNTSAGGTTTAGGTSNAGGSSPGGTTGDPDTDGKCGTTWAAGGDSGAPALAATVTPTNSGDVWTFTYGRYKFVVSAKTAGRIIEYSVGGKNIIYPSTQYGDSTFAPSPQSNYPSIWPPPAELDSNPYTATMADNILSLVGKTNNDLKLSFNKRFWVNAESGVVTLEYTIVNQATASATWAPWEITRVPAGGFTFAPKGPGTRTFKLNDWETAMPLTANGGINWLDYAAKASSMTKENYIVEFDGTEGWLAHAQSISSTPLLFVKSFKDAQDSALPPDQGEIQLWTNGSASADPKRIEVEEQGEQKALAAGGKLTWTVNWSLCELPATNVLAVGNADLVKYARAHAVKQ